MVAITFLIKFVIEKVNPFKMNKNCLIIFIFLINISLFSQAQNDFIFEEFSNPNSKNELSLYFKNEIPKKLLKKASFQPKKNNIVLSFSINKENRPYRILITNYRNTELKEAIKVAFVKYPLEKLNLTSFDKKNRYYLQIISKKGRKKVFNCSSKVIIETPPISENCEDLEFYEDIKTCLNKEVKNHFYKNANFNLLNNVNTALQSNLKDEKDIELFLYKKVELFVQFSISKKGKLINKKTKVPTVFNNEVLTVLNSFQSNIKPGTFNGAINDVIHSFKIHFKEGEKPVYKDRSLGYDSIFKINSKNDFALFLKTKITKEDLEKSNLTRIKKSVTLSFEVDKKNKPFNISTNARSSYLDNLIISSFKDYPMEKLGFSNKSAFNSYFTQVLSLNEGKVIIKTNEIIGYERVPVFPGCENSESLIEAKKCFSKGVQMHFSRKFDTSLPNNLGLSRGRKRVFIAFKINKEGNIFNIVVKAPHPKIKEEVISVMKKLPKVAPGFQGVKKVNVKYSIPFTLIVE